MDDRWQQIERIYHAARELNGRARVEYLAKACGSDPALRREVETLLTHGEQAGSFLEAPPVEAIAEAFENDEHSLSSREATFEPGAMIAHYRLAGKLGEGGMGEVYRARDTKLQRDVALKILPQAMSRDPQRMARFEREARTLASLNHPNIAAIHGLEESNGIRALVMELVEGETLAEKIDRQTEGFPAADALPIARQITEALEYAHEHGVIHRDLKPANVIITPEGTVKVLDFGLAKVLKPQGPTGDLNAANSPTLTTLATQPGTILGTAAYMSPEQAKGQRVDRRCDIWAFGCLLYEMLSGRKAFDGEAIQDVLVAVLTKEPDWNALPATTPAEIQKLICRSLQKNQRHRLQAIGDARIAIEETLSGSPLLTSPLPPEELRASPLLHNASGSQIIAVLVKRHRGKIAVFAAFIAATIVAGAYFGYRALRPASARQQAAAPASAPNMQITQLTTSGTAILAAISPDGRYVAYAQKDAGGQSLRLRQIATGSAVEVVPPSGVEFIGLTFSPDGNYLDYVQAPQSGAQLPALYQAPVLGGQTHKLLENVGSAVTFSPDGKRVAFVRGHSGGKTQLVVANADGSSERVLASKKPPQFFVPALAYGRPAWSPDGRVIAVSEGGYSPLGFHPGVYDVRTGQEQRFGSKRWIALEQLAWQPDGKGLLLEASSSGRQQILRLSYPGGKLRRITNDLNNYLGVSITADGAALATVQARLASNIWAAPKGEWDHPRQVTRGLSNADGIAQEGVSWTPSGRIVYSSTADGINSLWQADPARGQAAELIQKGIIDFAPSACGKAGLILFAARVKSASGGFTMEIWRANADGTGLEQLTHAGFDSEPSCSPDGRWVLYSSAAKIWKVPIGGGKPVQLTVKGMSWTPTISPDGKWILYFHSAGARSPWRYTIRPFAGGKPVKTFHTPFVHRGNSLGPAWMPDSRAFAYIVQKSGVSNIVEQPIAGGAVRQLTHFTSGHIFTFDVSHDGKLALARGTDSSDVVLIRNFQ